MSQSYCFNESTQSMIVSLLHFKVLVFRQFIEEGPSSLLGDCTMGHQSSRCGFFSTTCNFEVQRCIIFGRRHSDIAHAVYRIWQLDIFIVQTATFLVKSSLDKKFQLREMLAVKELSILYVAYELIR